MPFEDGKKTLITRENAYPILKAFAKAYKKEHGNYPLEIIIVGGGSILLNYGFRDYTQDFDIMVRSAGDIREVAYRIAEQYNLPTEWLNTDFTKTPSYSERLREVSKHYCTFNNGSLEFRTVAGEYLIAMKMVSARAYRNDISDIIGIMLCMRRDNLEITREKIRGAVEFLYPEQTIKKEVYDEVEGFLSLNVEELEKKYSEIKSGEAEIRQNLVWIDKNYPNTVTEQSIDAIMKDLKEKIRRKKDDTPAG